MKKLLTLALRILMAFSAILVGCSNTDANGDTTNEAATVKFGAGLYVSTPTVADATEDVEGSGKVDVTVAAVTVTADGKIAACDVDTTSNIAKFTVDGKALAGEFKTKYEQGASYNMVAYGANREWFEQADAFEALIVGKTLDEVKALVAEGNKGNDEVVSAGCTIMIHEFVNAIEKAYNAANTEISDKATLKVNIATEQTLTDATEEKEGTNKLAINVFAAAYDAEGKVVAASSDCVEVSFTFDITGVSTLDTAKAILSKKEQGTNYGMVMYGASDKEWFEQAAAFDAACIGKTKSEIASLEDADGYGVDDLKAAGCTVAVSGFVKAATK